MFPVTVTVHNLDQLRAVANALNGEGAPAATPAEATAPAAPAARKPRAAAAPTAAPAAAPAAAAPAAAPAADAQPTAFAADYCAKHVNEPLKALCLKDYPKAEALIKSYGVERASLIPDAKLPEFLAKVQEALDPGAAERKRLEALDAQQPAAAAKPSLF